MSEFFAQVQKSSGDILLALGQHAAISAVAIALGIIVAVPCGIILTRNKKAADVVLGIFGVVNTIPSIVLLGVAMIVFGLGFAPAAAVLFIYSLLPIMRATYTGISGLNPKYLKAARGMGMSDMQILRSVQLPLAAPTILTGIRLSSIYIISWATLAAFIGAGGLGDLIWMGLLSYNFNLMLCGAIPATLMSLLVSALLTKAVKLSSRHKTEEASV